MLHLHIYIDISAVFDVRSICTRFVKEGCYDTYVECSRARSSVRHFSLLRVLISVDDSMYNICERQLINKA